LDRRVPIPLSAKTPDALILIAKNLLQFIQSRPNSSNDLNLADLAYTLQVGRDSMEERVGFAVSSVTELEARLQKIVENRPDGSLFKGRVKADKGSLYAAVSNVSSTTPAETLRTEQDLETILELWVGGEEISWANLYRSSARPNRIGLPGYPFARERYWVSTREPETSSAIPFSGHPLLQCDRSTDGLLKFSSTFTGAEFFLQGHQVNGTKVLPGACILEMARAAAERVASVGSRMVRFQDIAWPAPFLIASEPREIQISLTSNDQRNFRFEVYSDGSGSETKVHGVGIVSLPMERQSRTLDLDRLRFEINQHRFDRTECYAELQRMGLNYSADFQCVDSISRANDQILARLKHLPLTPAARQLVLDTTMLDAGLHASIGFVLGVVKNDGNSRKVSSLPFAIDQIEIDASCSESMWAWIRPSAGSASNSSVQKLDIDLCDDHGGVAVRISGYSSRSIESVEAKSQIGIWRPVWAHPLVESEAQPVDWQNHEVISYKIAAEVLSAVGRSVSLIELPSSGGDLQSQITGVLLQVFKRVKDRMARSMGEKSLIQVLIAAQSDARLLSCLSGFARTVRVENKDVVLQLIEVGNDTSAGVLKDILEKNSASPANVHIRYEGEQQMVINWETLDATETSVPWKEGGVYLITGGAGGLGLIFAKEIASRCKGTKIILIGRSSLDREKTGKVHEIAAFDAMVEYRQVDVCDPSALVALIHEIRERFGRLDGVLHSAGVARDRLLINKTEDEFRLVLRPKVSGTMALDQALGSSALDLFVLFSSTGAVTGNLGQADYSTANAFLDEFARHRNERVKSGVCKGQTLSINWPLWRDGGLQVDAETEKAILRDSGMVPMESANGIQALYRAIATGESQVLIVQGNQKQFGTVLSGRFSEKSAKRSIASAKGKSDAEDRDIELAVEYVRKALASSLKIVPDRIDADESLERYGIDSIKGLQVIKNLEGPFGVLPKNLFFQCQTVTQIARYLLAAHREVMERLVPRVQINASAPSLNKTSSNKNISISAVQKSAPAPQPANGKSNGMESDALDIAIIGLAGRYPQAANLQEFWKNLQIGRDCITEIPPDRWDWRKFYATDKAALGTHHSKWGGFMSDVDKFDPLFFNISPKEANYIDPQERLFLQHAWMALEDAGYCQAERSGLPGDYVASQVGVYAGVMYGEYQLLAANPNGPGSGITIGNSYASIANRVSYVLDLHGPSMTVDTMCSSSLSCIHLACQDLKHGKTDLAIAGAVNVSIHPNKYLLLSAGQFLSQKGHCESFGEGGDGYIPGEGVGVAILKRLADAERDGDFIYGIIKGSAINHGGRTNGYSVPNPNAQQAVIAQAIKEAGIDPRHITYVEAHGTGTSMGDPIEVVGLTKAFRGHTDKNQYCSLGSAKSNVGHCESAAGIAGLTKVLLQMQHRQIVPSLHAEVLNTNIDFATTPFVVNRELREWKVPMVDGKSIPRTAGLSSFGAGGSNAHMIIQEYNGPSVPQNRQPEDSGACLIVLSAKNDKRLQEKIRELHQFVRETPSIRLQDLAFTLQVGRKAMEERVAFVALSIVDLEKKLDAVLAGEDNAVEGIHRGQVKSYRQTLSSFKVDEELQEAITKWIERKKFFKLADLWVKGLSLDWNLLYPESRPFRIPLPTYPFARDRYWLETGSVPLSQSAHQPDFEKLNANVDSDESFHAEMFDRLLAGEIGIERALDDLKGRSHGI
jgi:polyketide synthase PksN